MVELTGDHLHWLVRVRRRCARVEVKVWYHKRRFFLRLVRGLFCRRPESLLVKFELNFTELPSIPSGTQSF